MPSVLAEELTTMGDVVDGSPFVPPGGGAGSGGPRFSPRQIKAIALVAAGESLADIGRAVGVTPRTVRRWRALPGFNEAVEALVQAEFTNARRVLTQGSTKAARELARLSQAAKPDHARIAACRAILALGAELGELADLRERLEKLEGGGT